MPERKFDDFNEHAADYRQTHTDNIRLSGADSFYFAEMKVVLLKDHEKNIPLRVLDVGCGDGATELYFKKHFPTWKINGIDISDRSIEAARARNLDGVSFNTYDGRTMEFDDDSFDIVFMAGVLHHVSYDLHGSLLAEISRILKKGGRFYLFEHNPINPMTRYLVKTCVFDKNAKLLPAGYTTMLLKKNHFSIRYKRFIIFFPRKGLLSRLIFSEKYLSWLPLGGQYFLSSVKV